MKRKNDLFEELNIECEQGFSSPLNIDKGSVRQRVKAKLDSAYTERKTVTMRSKKKIALIAVAAALTLGISAFAAGGVVSSWFSSSSSVPDYKSLPTAEEVKKDIGYDALIIGEFENGYAFKNGSVIDNGLSDGDGNTVERFKSVSFDYEKEGDTVTFTEDCFSSEVGIAGEVVKSLNGTDIYYHSYKNKSVPADYQLTKEDKTAEESGELVFSYGSPEVEIHDIQTVTWMKDGMHFQMLQIDGRLSSGELVKMAEEVINK